MTRKPYTDSESLPHSPAKKNKRRWCKGKVGVEHKPAALLDRRWAHSKTHWWIYHCIVCGKHLDYWWDCPWSSKIKPPWVPR